MRHAGEEQAMGNRQWAMKRPRNIIKLCVYVLLFAAGGAIVNVAVAWGSAWLVGAESRLESSSTFDFALEVNRIATSTSTRLDIGRTTFITVGAFPVSPSEIDQAEQRRIDPLPRDLLKEINIQPFDAQTLRSNLPLVLDARGWPAFSMKSQMTFDARGRQWLSNDGRLIRFSKTSRPPEILPLSPIWSGFAINSGFYAAMLWLVFAVPGWLRRSIRRRRGLCPRCGYDLRGQAAPAAANSGQIVCPVCGSSA
jgi:hypothetical protein